MLWLARRSEQGLLKRNQIAGVRTALTLSSDAAWYPAKRAAAPSTRFAGWGAVFGGAAVATLALWGLTFDTTMVIYTIFTFGSASWLIGWVLAGPRLHSELQRTPSINQRSELMMEVDREASRADGERFIRIRLPYRARSVSRNLRAS